MKECDKMRRDFCDNPQFTALKNSDLVCRDCVLKNDEEFSVAACAAYPYIKPTKILDGGMCEHHITLDEAMEKYGEKYREK